MIGVCPSNLPTQTSSQPWPSAGRRKHPPHTPHTPLPSAHTHMEMHQSAPPNTHTRIQMHQSESRPRLLQGRKVRLKRTPMLKGVELPLPSPGNVSRNPSPKSRPCRPSSRGTQSQSACRRRHWTSSASSRKDPEGLWRWCGSLGGGVWTLRVMSPLTGHRKKRHRWNASCCVTSNLHLHRGWGAGR